jgi:hypothetical protein
VRVGVRVGMRVRRRWVRGMLSVLRKVSWWRERVVWRLTWCARVPCRVCRWTARVRAVILRLRLLATV